jgi:DNA-binding transcriptional ArsR family regulator
VSELVATVRLTQPAVSQHLKVLREARLVQARKHGQQRIYSVNREGLADLRAYVDSLWEDVLGAFEQAAAEQAARAPASQEERKTHHV